MAQTQKEILRDTVLTQMQPYLDAMAMDMLNQALLKALFYVDVVEMQTLPATQENTNEYIFKLFDLKKAPKISSETAKYYKSSVKHLIDFTGKSLISVTDMDIEYYLDEYRKGKNGKPNKTVTVNNERRNISAFFTWMRKSHIVVANPAESIEKYAEPEMPIDHLTDREMEALRDACTVKTVNKITKIEEYKECLRDRALIEFLRSTAVRIGECASVNISDIDWATGNVLVYGEKGKAYRTVCIDETAKYHIEKYINSRDDNDPALFVSKRGDHKRMERSGLRVTVKKIAERSVLERNVYPHLFRKTTATNMAKRGCPRELIAFYLGHKYGNTKTLNKHYAATDQQQVVNAFWQYGAAA